jgi:hypothetical protein
MKTLHLLIIASASLTIAYLVSFLTSSNLVDGEIISAQTNKLMFHYGEPITLQILDFNTWVGKDISNIENTYAGDPSPCGEAYFDFVFLKGDHSDIRNYDQLVLAKNNTLNVKWGTPFDVIMCPYLVENISHVIMDPFSSHVAIFFGNGKNPNKIDENLLSFSKLDHVYDKKPSYKQISANTTQEYIGSQIIPSGKYTIIAFNLAGKISKPILITVD